MILIGQYDSPFVRRVAIALRLYGIAYDHRPWSVFADAALIRPYNPLGRVPTLVLENGIALLESAAILDYLDDLAGPAALFPPTGHPRMIALRQAALAMGLAEKAVALVYENRLHDHPAATVVARIEQQIAAVLDALEAERAACHTNYLNGAAPGHADIALACAAGFVARAAPLLLRHPAIAAHAARCEALEAFQAINQPFRPPGK